MDRLFGPNNPSFLALINVHLEPQGAAPPLTKYVYGHASQCVVYDLFKGFNNVGGQTDGQTKLRIKATNGDPKSMASIPHFA